MGKIHSVETFGTVDGPGIRYVVFFQGCPMRCKFCHNPDTWNKKLGTETTSQQIIDNYMRNKAFYKNGGITATGGEPLFQLPFLIELFTKAKENKIHTCLDTSGCIPLNENIEMFEKLSKITDLIMLDIKHSDFKGYKELTGSSLQFPLDFLKFMNDKEVEIQIRHVLVPNITLKIKQLENLGKIIAPYKMIKSLDVLPYHKMGISKYEQLGIPYPLKNIEETKKEEVEYAKKIIISSIKKNTRGAISGKRKN